jgi:hypothetical protein
MKRIGTLLLLACALGGCSPDSTMKTPEGTVEAFVDASREGNKEKMEQLVLEADLAEWRQFDNPFLKLSEEEKDEVEIDMGDTKIDEDKAVVEYKLRLKEKMIAYGVIVALKEDGKWKVSRERSTMHTPEGSNPPGE